MKTNHILPALLLVLNLAGPAFAFGPSIIEVGGQTVSSGTVANAFEVPVGKTLVVPVATDDPSGDGLAYAVTSSLPHIKAQARTGNPCMQIVVKSGTDADNPQISGTMQLLLFRDFAPTTADMIGGMAQGGYYDGLKFHRVISGFMMQGGDPNGDGTGGPGFAFPNEFDPALIFSGSGQLAMANSSFDSNYEATNGSQFFLTLGQARWLDFNHTIFGQLVRGFDVMSKVENVEKSLVQTSATTSELSKPVVDVVMESVSMVTNKSDAVLLLTATNGGSATVTINVTDAAGAIHSVSMVVTGIVDETNDPPILFPLQGNIVGKDKIGKFPLRAIDLEDDPMTLDAWHLDANSLHLLRGGTLLVKGSVAGYEGSSSLLAGVCQTGATTRGSSNYLWDFQTMHLGFGAKKLTLTPAQIKTSASTPVTAALATLLDADKTTTPADITATINWGDGSPLASGTGVTVTQSDFKTQRRFLISGSHAYAETGTYSVRVVIEGKKGVRISTVATVNVTDQNMAANGTRIVAASGKVKGKVVATFSDDAPAGAMSYGAEINWGDGTRSAGTVVATGSNSFSVKGEKTYRDNGTYSVWVEVSRSGAEAVAWSRAVASGLKVCSLPPFPSAHITTVGGEIAQTGQVVSGISRYFVMGHVQMRNAGRTPLAGAQLRFYLSDDTTLDGADIQLPMADGSPAINLPKLKANSAVLDFLLQKKTAVQLPGDSSGKYLFGTYIYNSAADFQNIDWYFSVQL